VFGVLPMAFTGDGIVTVGRLGEGAILVVFPLPLALAVGRGLLAGLRRSCVAHDIGARTIAAVGVILGYHFGHFASPRARSIFGPGTAADGVWA
jgi:hypothetical protein